MAKTLRRFRAFFDTDVVISSILSKTGAAHVLVRAPMLERYVSTLSSKEIKEVGHRLEIPPAKTEKHLQEYFTNVKLEQKQVSKYHKFVFDPKDSHIVAGAVKAEAGFIATYNLKDYNQELINSELSLVVLSPGQLIQFLRSMKIEI